MRVAEYRREISRLENNYHTHRHACVSSDEARRHVEVCRRSLDDLMGAHAAVKRAKAADKQRAEAIMTTVATWLRDEADQWAAELSGRHGRFCTRQAVLRASGFFG